jgi:hypothetical protein
MLIGAGAAHAQVTDLVATLSLRLGLTREQAVRGAGAVFRLASQRLGPAEFSIIAESVPGIARVVDAAPAIAETGGGLDDLTVPFSLLGIAPSLIPAFVEIVVDFVGTAGSDPAAGLLRRSLVGS